MTDKQNFEVNARFEYGAYLTPKAKDKGINNITDKQITIDYKNLCENYSKEAGCCNTFDGSCSKEECFTYRLLQLLQAKEQECEELKTLLNAKEQKLIKIKQYIEDNEWCILDEMYKDLEQIIYANIKRGGK